MLVEDSLVQMVQGHEEKEESLEEDVFDLVLDQELYQKVHCVLYPSYILIYLKRGNNQQLKMTFNFDLIFELQRQECPNNKLGKPIGLKFEKFEKMLFLRNQNQNTLLTWKNILAKKINQRGFHQLVKPIKKIGKGNFATVYLVHKYENGQKAAVKAFSKDGTYSEEFGKESLVNQIEIMRKFQHKNLMKLEEIFQSQNSIYISVELLEGGQLYDKIKAKHKFTPAETKTVMKGILEGLEVMHMKDIMHRDLKPENILFRQDGDYDCVIADFGLAQNCHEDYMFVRCGTPGYVAPEVVNLKDLKAKYSPICDLFSVGVIFHLIALRKSPFPGREYDEVLSQNRHCNINYEHAMYQNMPSAWLNLLKRLLEKNPEKRISATEALNHDFFCKDQLFKNWTEHRRNNSLGMDECASPLMMTKCQDRKKKVLIKNDSCLKFKMKENIMTGRTDINEDMVDEISSPAAIKSKAIKVNESRFKKAS